MTSAHAPPTLTPGYNLDRYELLCPIAEGGMASVWAARLRGKYGFEKLVAIKTILPAFARDARFRTMFLDEARIASKIEHVNVARILDLGEEHDVLYLAMEYVDGDALSKLSLACEKEGTRIPPGVVLRVLADTAAGLHEAHELVASGRSLDVVHRDVSPQNIMIASRGIAKLIDFGVAKARNRLAGDTKSGFLKGKLLYMAPEQALERHVDRRTDVWAMGAVLYCLLSGRPPYEGENPRATFKLLTSKRPPLPLPSAVHAAISAVARKALAYAPEDRYQTAADLRDALERAMVDAGVPTSQADVAAFTTTYLGEQAARRRQAIEIALAAAERRGSVDPGLPPASPDSSWASAEVLSLSGDRISDQAPPRCSRHDLALASDGKCVLCRREEDTVATDPPKPSASAGRSAWILASTLVLTGALFLVVHLSSTPTAARSPREPPEGARASSTASVPHVPPSAAPLAPLEPAQIAADQMGVASDSGAPFSLDSAMHLASITLYSRPDMLDCRLARNWLLAHGYAFHERDVGADDEAAAQWRRTVPDGTVPAFDIDGQTFGGYDPSRLEAALEYAGARRLQRRGRH